MTNETFKDIEKLEADLWEAADNLRANSKLTSGDYFMPVLGVIFLRHAANRFEAAGRGRHAFYTSSTPRAGTGWLAVVRTGTSNERTPCSVVLRGTGRDPERR